MKGLEKPFRKESDPKNRKNSKNQIEVAACEQKTTTDKANFCSNTVFSLYFKIRAKKFHAAKPLAFSLHFLFRRDQNHYSNMTWKIMKMCEQILKKKRQRPNTIQILWIVKNHDVPNNSRYRFAAINKHSKHRGNKPRSSSTHLKSPRDNVYGMWKSFLHCKEVTIKLSQTYFHFGIFIFISFYSSLMMMIQVFYY